MFELDDKENGPRLSGASLAKKVVQTAGRIEAFLEGKRYSGQVEESCQTQLSSCLDLLSGTEKLLQIASDTKLPGAAQPQSPATHKFNFKKVNTFLTRVAD